MFDPAQLGIIYRLVLAAVLGAVLGFEREYVGKSAGLRTYMLVSFGSALFTILSSEGLSGYVGISSFDPSRVISQIVVGVGFIGAGLIIFQENKIRGLTTAAEMWVVAAIGATVGLNLYIVAIFSTIFVLTVLSLTRLFNLEEKIEKLAKRENGDSSSK